MAQVGACGFDCRFRFRQDKRRFESSPLEVLGSKTRQAILGSPAKTCALGRVWASNALASADGVQTGSGPAQS